MNRHFLRVLGAAALVLTGATASAQTTIYVQSGALAGTGTCAQPHGNLKAAIDQGRTAATPVVIRVAQGTYNTPNDRNLKLDYSDVTIRGGYAPGFAGCAAAVPVANPALTVLDGQSLDRHVRILPQRDLGADGLPDTNDEEFLAVNTGIVIDNLTFRNGKPAAPEAGGSLIILNCSVAISNSVFDTNSTNDHFFGGGAIYHVGYATAGPTFNVAQLDLTNDTFQNNQTGAGFSGSGPGGAIFAADINVDAGPPVNVQRLTTVNATNTIFRQNVSNGSMNNLPTDPYCLDGAGAPAPNLDCDADGTAESCGSRSIGGAVYLSNIHGTWDNNQFIGNQALARQSGAAAFVDASGQGGGVATFASTNGRGASPALTNNVFQNNTADAGRGAASDCGYFSAWGGAAYLVYFDTPFTGNTVENNTATAAANSAPQGAWGGGVFIIPLTTTPGISPLIDDNTFTANHATGGGGDASGWGGGLLSNEFGQAASPIITNNTFSANTCSGAVGGAAYGGGLIVGASGFYTMIVGNVIEDNSATGVPTRFSGVGGGLRVQLSDNGQIIADNVIQRNSGSDIVAGLNFAGAALLASAEDDPAASPTFMNNLVVENQGAGLGLIGFPTTASVAFSSPPLINNTIAANEGAGILMNLSDDMVFDSDIIYGNDTGGSGIGEIFDNFLTDSRPSEGQLVTHTLIGVLPTDPPDFVASANNPANANLIGIDPLFITGPGPSDYYLRQRPDNPAPSSPAVDAGPVLASDCDYGANPGMAGRHLGQRTTRTGAGLAGAQSPDTCFVDLGYHYALGAIPADTDSDGLPDADETAIGTNPTDADSDDDGVPDGADCGADIDGDGTIAALDCDTDGDGLTDGTETGVTVPTAGTNTAARCNTSNAPCGSASAPTYTADADTRTTTNPLDADTDDGGEVDGCEDADDDGMYDGAVAGERNPTIGGDDDADRDTIGAGLEISFYGTDPLDADTDDDGIADGADYISPVDPLFDSDPLNCDTDGDLIMDGVERSLGPVADPDGPGFPAKGTDCPPNATYCLLPCFAPDADPFVMTSPGPDGVAGTFDDVGTGSHTATACSTPPVCEGWDTDGDTCGDGEEDLNQNGRVDGGETDPNLAGDCSGGGSLLINIDDRTVALLDLTQTAACGMLTRLTADAIMATSCSAPITTGCNPTQSLAAPTRTANVTPGTPTTLTGEARDTFEPGVLVYYELADCTYTIRLSKSGADLVIDAQ